MPQLHSKLYPDILYDPVDGTFVRVRTYKQYTIRDDRLLRYYDSVLKRQIVIKALRVAWEIMNDSRLPEGLCLYHRNFDEQDFRAANIAAVDKETFTIIREAVSNVTKDLKYRPHPELPHCFIVQWKEDKFIRHRVVHDVVSAKKLYRKLLVKYTKILGKYCSSQ